jgi:hypothetical protein
MGLIQQAMQGNEAQEAPQQQAPQAPVEAPPQGADAQAPQQGGKTPGPVQTLVLMAWQIMYGQGPQLALQKLQTYGDDYVGAISETASMIIQSVFNTVKEDGRVIPQDVAAKAIKIIVAEVTELAMLGELFPQDQMKSIGQKALIGTMYELKQSAERGQKGQPQQPQQEAGA